MTTANKITIGRMLMIPVFVAIATAYGLSVRAGTPNESIRWAAVIFFTLTAASDGLDGFLARHFDQRSRLGSILDPLADKLLLMAAILAVSLSGWPRAFPLWFPILVVVRDLILIFGAWALHVAAGRFELIPHWTGKCATFMQMVALAWVMLAIPIPDPMVPTVIAGAFTIFSGTRYIYLGFRHYFQSLRSHAHQRD